MGAEEGGGARGFGGSDVFGGSLGHDSSARLTALGSNIDQVVSLSQYIEMMFDHDNGMA